MKHLFFLPILFAANDFLNAQSCPTYNINGGFENVTSTPDCSNPTASMSVTKASGWACINSADVFNSSMQSCLGGSYVRSGTYAAGFSMFSNNREFIYRNVGTLMSGKSYKITAYFKNGTSGVGFWVIPGTTVTMSNLGPSAQLQNPTWTYVSGWWKYEKSFTLTTGGNYMLAIGSSTTANLYICVDDITLSLSQPALVVTNDGPKCYPNCVNIGANVSGGSTPYTYLWSNGFTTQSQPICVPVAQNYNVTVTDNAGCTVSGSTFVEVYPALSISAGPDVYICGTPNPTTNYAVIGFPAVCGKGNPKTYSWSPTTGLSNPTGCYTNAYPPSTTVYTLTATDLVTGCTGHDQVTVTLLIPPCDEARYSNDGNIENVIDEAVSALYPNPSDGQVHLNYTLKSDQTGRIVISDLMGKELGSYLMEAGSSVLNINANHLSSGMYLYHIVLNGEIIKTDKFSVIK